MIREGLLVAVMLVAACSSSTGSESSPPLTLAEKCAQSCRTPTSAGNPCHTQTPPADCQSTCETTLAGKSDDCVSCFFGSAGWTGTTCDCDKADLLGDISCKECTYRGSGTSCVGEITNKCTSGQVTCAGWKPIALDDQLCAARCGMQPDIVKYRCQNGCLPPRDGDCRMASAAQQTACVDTCTTQMKGKTDDCIACYLQHSSWSSNAGVCQGWQAAPATACATVCGG